VEAICQKYDGISISALQPDSLEKFFLAIERKLWEKSHSMNCIDNVKLTNGGSSDISNINFQMRVREDDGDLS
jgi:hypothetical protein